MFNRKDLTATSLGLRIIVGGYFLYLAYSILPTILNSPTKNEMIAFIIAAPLFVLVGGGIVFFSVKALIKGEYVKGNKKEEESIQTNPENDSFVEDKEEQQDDINEIEDILEEEQQDDINEIEDILEEEQNEEDI